MAVACDFPGQPSAGKDVRTRIDPEHTGQGPLQGQAPGRHVLLKRFTEPHSSVKPHTKNSSMIESVGAALLYGITGIGAMLISKVAFSVYKFPSPPFIAFLQLMLTTSSIAILKQMHFVQFEDLSINACRMVWPMPIFFMGNALCSLGGTQAVSVPTFSALRKFSILMVMVLEKVVLKKTPSRNTQGCVGIMILGAFVASAKDLDFDLFGYIYVMANNLFTAFNYIVTKQKSEQPSLGAVGSLFYCALLSLPVGCGLAARDFDSLYNFPHWSSGMFLACLCGSTVMGCLTTFSIIYCTKVNSGLTTSVVGCLRNVFPVYIGMLSIFGYTFDVWNFIGHSISVIGAVLYTCTKLWEDRKKKEEEKRRDVSTDAEP
uniref:Sugar phosphate transporter domain-containing protein n=1 Tax=Eutreptiella gymnastica TaxID=73025 RepID=A0A7S1J7R7_9EUGL